MLGNCWLVKNCPIMSYLIITPVIGYISIPHLYSAQFSLPWEHSLPGIAAYNGAGKFKHNNLSPPTGSPFIHLGREQQRR